MRSLVVASVAALALSGLTGCQGGEEAAQDPTTGTTTPTAEETTPTAEDTTTPTVQESTPTPEDTPTPDDTGEDYSQAFVTNFMRSCVASSGGMRETCQCILDAMEAKFSEQEATNLARKITTGGGLPKSLQDIILGCR